MILIVDDNQENIFSLKILLELNKFTVDTAASGDEALKKVLKNNYSLIILDVQMPNMDGFEVAEAISGYSKSRDIPIIFLSAVNIHKKYVIQGYNSGGVDYVTKPFDPDILLFKVKTFYRLSEQKRRLIAMDASLREEIEFRKKAEEELEHKVEELKSTLESMPQMAFTTCARGKIEFVNNHWLLCTGSATGFPETEGISIQKCMAMAIESGKQLIQEVRIKIFPQQESRFHVIYLTPVKKNGTIIRWVGMFTDIHEQKMASQTLEQKVGERTRELLVSNQQLEHKNFELQKFAFIASHDLQEPLRKIQIFSDLVGERYAGDSENTKKFTRKIVSSAERMRRLINDLLSYSRVSAKELFQPSDINEMINEALQDYELQIKSKKANIQVDKFPLLEVIPGQIRQIFHNLIGNALKFSKDSESPQITIEAGFVNSKLIGAPIEASGDFCRICVRDNGVGFDQVYADKIFEIFQRLNQHDNYEGTGIGLAIVKKIVETHHGIIAARSTEGQGATFIIILPLNQNIKSVLTDQHEDEL